jgi:hypothetical protein
MRSAVTKPLPHCGSPEHLVTSSHRPAKTQVSLLPPPWEEFTT